jgi:hypothetical protein
VRGRTRLGEVGAQLGIHDYNIGHWIAPEEVADAVAFVDGKGADSGVREEG